MLRIVIDTNVVVSALLTKNGNAAQIVDMIFTEHFMPVYNGKILSEYSEVIARARFGFCIEDQKRVIAGIREYGISIDPTQSSDVFTDESDRIFYETAKAANALLVTGNVRHFPDETCIISLAECVRLLVDGNN